MHLLLKYGALLAGFVAEPARIDAAENVLVTLVALAFVLMLGMLMTETWPCSAPCRRPPER